MNHSTITHSFAINNFYFLTCRWLRWSVKETDSSMKKEKLNCCIIIKYILSSWCIYTIHWPRHICSCRRVVKSAACELWSHSCHRRLAVILNFNLHTCKFCGLLSSDQEYIHSSKSFKFTGQWQNSFLTCFTAPPQVYISQYGALCWWLWSSAAVRLLLVTW